MPRVRIHYEGSCDVSQKGWTVSIRYVSHCFAMLLRCSFSLKGPASRPRLLILWHVERLHILSPALHALPLRRWQGKLPPRTRTKDTTLDKSCHCEVIIPCHMPYHGNAYNKVIQSISDRWMRLAFICWKWGGNEGTFFFKLKNAFAIMKC